MMRTTGQPFALRFRLAAASAAKRGRQKDSLSLAPLKPARGRAVYPCGFLDNGGFPFFLCCSLHAAGVGPGLWGHSSRAGVVLHGSTPAQARD